MRGRVPVVEIARQIDRSGVRGGAIETDWLNHVLCRIGPGAEPLKNCVHTVWLLNAYLAQLTLRLRPNAKGVPMLRTIMSTRRNSLAINWILIALVSSGR